ncbi:hypothetical protein LTS18_003226 [Coniosporium uncinatum]|uniref:Uncharacterized protein n=1 Tax=Coniosporium uncinatum TaxID=93489 RepID=A0ACC3DU16_9PEZI|nr:hypothetical protein LTS18_003226 [Coniosporium uncinatum]
MPTLPLHPPSPLRPAVSSQMNPLPHLLQTPSGLAIVEIQGTIHTPPPPSPPPLHSSASFPVAEDSDDDDGDDDDGDAVMRDRDAALAPALAVLGKGQHAPVGRLVFPLYEDATAVDGEGREGSKEGDTKWMKKVYLYVGKHQRMTGEVKRLSKPLAVVRRRERVEEGGGGDGLGRKSEREREGLEVVEVVRWKVVFGQRPEPVGGE